MNMLKITKRGTVTVEAAIILPVFLIALLTIGYTIRTIGASECVMHAMADECRLIQTYAYDVKLGAAYPLKLENRLDETEEIDRFTVEEFDYLFGDGYIRLDGEYAVRNRMPIRLHSDFIQEEGLFFRGFVPHDNSGEIYSFDRMQCEDDGSTVWVFPRAGERYHDENCTYIQRYPRQVLLIDDIRSKYEPCRFCRPEEYANGHVVYVFQWGDVYHDGSCTLVDRYVVPMSRKEADSHGYGACSRCGG